MSLNFSEFVARQHWPRSWPTSSPFQSPSCAKRRASWMRTRSY